MFNRKYDELRNSDDLTKLDQELLLMITDSIRKDIIIIETIALNNSL